MKFVFLGAGGSGLSALVSIFNDLGFEIIGIEQSQNEISKKLENKGIKILKEYDIKDEILIYTDAAINHPLVKKAKIKFSYFELIGEISKYYKTIAVAGTSGKSTTTGMLMYTLNKLNLLSLGIVGAILKENQENYIINNKEYLKEVLLYIFGKNKNIKIKKDIFVIEADEFNKHMLLLDPYYSIITSINYDHIDTYPTKEEYINAFKKFITLTKGKVFIHSKYKNLFDDKKIHYIKNTKINLKFLFGKHNIENANLVYKFIKNIFNIDSSNIIENFKGLRRRLELLKENIYTDYGHHPNEIEKVYKALREKYKKENIIAIFQPHQIKRLIGFYNDYVNILKKFDEIIIYKPYSARENIEDVSIYGKNLARDVNGIYIEDLDSIKNFLEKKGIKIIISAGDLDYKIRSIITL